MPHNPDAPQAAAQQAQSALPAYAMLVFTTLCWGANAIFSKLAVGEIPPMLLVSVRWMGVVVLLLVFASSYVRKDWLVMRSRLPFVAAMGVMGFTAFNILFYTAAYTTSALNIGIIQGCMPIFVLIGIFLAYRTPITALQSLGILITFAGVLFVASQGDLSQLVSLTFRHGDILMLIACTLYAAYTVGLRRRPDTSALGLFTVLAGAAFLASIPFSIWEYARGDSYWPSGLGWTVTALVTVFPSFLAQIFFIHGVSRLGPGRAGAFINLVPVFAALLAVAVLGESFEVYHLVALLLVLGGIWLSKRGKAM